jgi:DNA-binding HxlR family transcriptional regulator
MDKAIEATMQATPLTVTCPLEHTLHVLSGRWKVLIVRELLFNGTKRFGELQRALTGVSQRMLIRELKELQGHGIVHREAFDENPPRVEYRLTDKGHTLTPILAAMSNWATEHFVEDDTFAT